MSIRDNSCICLPLILIHLPWDPDTRAHARGPPHNLVKACVRGTETSIKPSVHLSVASKFNCNLSLWFPGFELDVELTTHSSAYI